ncbi:MAG: Nif3-like dinuclear metal center hexameric protein [Gammaproteobacteria bacterium]|nr:Nif3-like dinuclear metal center hexameric protein [Gammaproteobacteria bacterium]
MPTIQQLSDYCGEYLKIRDFRDYCPNGLQVEGRSEVKKLATGVTASLAFIEQALEWGADALLVHHGYFWKHEDATITGIKKRRLQRLLTQDVSLLAYHLPLDAHPEVGNNACLAALLGIDDLEPLQAGVRRSVGNVGSLPENMKVADFVTRCEQVLGRDVLHINSGAATIRRVALCTGGAQTMIDDAIRVQADLYLSGEISEQTVHIAREAGIHFIAAGHHATERYGAEALGAHLEQEFNLIHRFFDIDNPA